MGNNLEIEITTIIIWEILTCLIYHWIYQIYRGGGSAGPIASFLHLLLGKLEFSRNSPV